MNPEEIRQDWQERGFSFGVFRDPPGRVWADFTHQTDVAEVFLSQGGQFANNNLPGFLSQGTDGLRLSSAFAHQHAMESIWTLGMNDIHDAFTPHFRPQWKQDNPTRIMSTLEDVKDFSDRRRMWSLVDFEHPDVEPRLRRKRRDR